METTKKQQKEVRFQDPIVVNTIPPPSYAELKKPSNSFHNGLNECKFAKLLSYILQRLTFFCETRKIGNQPDPDAIYPAQSYDDDESSCSSSSLDDFFDFGDQIQEKDPGLEPECCFQYQDDECLFHWFCGIFMICWM
jgi:hypothetical protein